MYNEIVMEHFQHPRNVGEIPDADGKGEIGSQVCGDTMVVYLKVKDDIIEDVKFKTYGCCAAIASSSIATEMVKGKTIEEAEKLTKAAIIEKLGGLPDPKIHCSLLAEDAIHAAIDDYKKKKQA
jgi:nitrogen fixation NifU-like protein